MQGGTVFSSNINKNTTTDTGVESLKLLHNYGSKAVNFSVETGKLAKDTLKTQIKVVDRSIKFVDRIKYKQAYIKDAEITLDEAKKQVEKEKRKLIAKVNNFENAKKQLKKSIELRKLAKTAQAKKNAELEIKKAQQIVKKAYKVIKTAELEVKFAEKSVKIAQKALKLIKQGAIIIISQSLLKGAGKLLIKVPKKVIISGISSAKNAILNQRINMGEVTDSGIESLKLIGQSFDTVGKAKNAVVDTVKATKFIAKTGFKITEFGIKTTKKTIKTSVRFVKKGSFLAVKNGKKALDLAYKTGSSVVRASQFLARIAIRVIRIIAEVTAQIVALAMNPLTWITVGIVLIILMLSGIFIALFGGDTSAKKNVIGASGLANGTSSVEDVYNDGIGYFNIKMSSMRADFYAEIDSLYYDINDRENSDLVYLSSRQTGANTINYITSFAYDAQKTLLKGAFDRLSMTAEEAIAIAYVYLEKPLNNAKNTVMTPYPVTLTQADIDNVLSQFFSISETVTYNAYCPNNDCKTITPADGSAPYDICDGLHETHDFSLNIRSKDEVMNILGFTDKEKEWVDLTILGLKNMPTNAITTP
jgi:hypothetical protein